VVLSPANEYEVLQLLLGECRERLAAYAGAPPHRAGALSMLATCLQQP
jgi:hypothetical protein